MKKEIVEFINKLNNDFYIKESAIFSSYLLCMKSENFVFSKDKESVRKLINNENIIKNLEIYPFNNFENSHSGILKIIEFLKYFEGFNSAEIKEILSCFKSAFICDMRDLNNINELKENKGRFINGLIECIDESDFDIFNNVFEFITENNLELSSINKILKLHLKNGGKIDFQKTIEIKKYINAKFQTDNIAETISLLNHKYENEVNDYEEISQIKLKYSKKQFLLKQKDVNLENMCLQIEICLKKFQETIDIVIDYKNKNSISFYINSDDNFAKSFIKSLMKTLDGQFYSDNEFNVILNKVYLDTKMNAMEAFKQQIKIGKI